MTTIQRIVDVRVPARAAYAQWASFESFPRFIEGVHRVRRVDTWLTRWETRIREVRREFDVEIIARHPGELIAWNAVDGLAHGGMVTFTQLGGDDTLVRLMIRYEPDLLPRQSATALAALCAELTDDLQRFKRLVEHDRLRTSCQDQNRNS